MTRRISFGAIGSSLHTARSSRCIRQVARSSGRSSAFAHGSTVGALYKPGLLNRELLFDWLAVAPIWDRLKGFALGMRKDRKVPQLWENFELMAKAQAE